MDVKVSLTSFVCYLSLSFGAKLASKQFVYFTFGHPCIKGNLLNGHMVF